MANILVAGGGFAGIVAAELLARKLGREHDIRLISRSKQFVFYPALVRLAFGECAAEEIEFNVRESMADRKIRFIEGEVARIYPSEKRITIAHGDVEGNVHYDYLVLALGRRLKTESVAGYFDHANHLLTPSAAKKFGSALDKFKKGTAVIGYCEGARLPVPVFETAFALSRKLEREGHRADCQIKIVVNESLDGMFGGVEISESLVESMTQHGIELINNFSIGSLTADAVIATDGRVLNYDLNMILPPFCGPGALVGTNLDDDQGYVVVDTTMKASKCESIYAIGDCVSLPGPKMGHMAVRQARVAAENLMKEIRGERASVTYEHEIMMVIDAGGGESTFVHQDFGNEDGATISQSRFWGWAKQKQQQYWKAQHS